MHKYIAIRSKQPLIRVVAKSGILTIFFNKACDKILTGRNYIVEESDDQKGLLIIFPDKKGNKLYENGSSLILKNIEYRIADGVYYFELNQAEDVLSFDTLNPIDTDEL